MVLNDPQLRIAELVEGRPWMARILIAYGLDPTSGTLSLARACHGQRVDVQELMDTLARVADGPSALAGLSQRQLVKHIVDCHHRYLRRVVPGLQRQLDGLVGLLPHLGRLQLELQLFWSSANPHMFREEQVIFPAIRELERDRTLGAHMQRWVDGLLADHEIALGHFLVLRQITVNYRPEPRWGPEYQLLMAALADLDDDMRWHMHAENDLLLPRALETLRAA